MTRVRLGTIAAGMVLALAALLVLAFAGVGADRPRSNHPTGSDARAGEAPRTAVQPELAGALLARAELPPGYLPSPDAGATWASQPKRRPTGKRLITECTNLFERLGDAGTGVTRESRGPGGSVLRQALAVLPTATAAGAVRDAHRLASHCRQFTAALDDGTMVAVEMAPAAPVGTPRPTPAGTETVTIRLRVTADDRTLEGYLTLGRVGGAMSVLRQLGPRGTITPAAVEGTLRTVLDKLAPLTTLVVPEG